MSLNFCSREEKAAIEDVIMGVKFTSPYGKEVQKYLSHGIGIHHAGLLPKYRMLVEQLAQRGLLKVICGTDTLGVGVNVPIRTVLLHAAEQIRRAEDGHPFARGTFTRSRARGARGFDDIGFVVAQAPEHVIENLKMDAKAAGDAKKLEDGEEEAAEKGFVGWDEETFKKLDRPRPRSR